MSRLASCAGLGAVGSALPPQPAPPSFFVFRPKGLSAEGWAGIPATPALAR
jgi:hypothetical protein